MGNGCDLLNEHSERDWQADVQAVTLLTVPPAVTRRTPLHATSMSRRRAPNTRG
jgi:hypothetical protein